MAINNTKVLFQYGSGSAAAAVVAGALTFDATAKAIYVGDGSVANLVTSAVKDATFTNRVLTVSKVDGTSFTLDFSDVASAEGVNSLLATLRDDIDALDASVSTLKGRVDNHDTLLANLNTSITNLDAAYQAADTALETKLVGNASAGYNTLGKLQAKIEDVDAVAGDAQTSEQVQTAITNAISNLDSLVEDADASSFVNVKVEETDGKLTAITVTTTDIAKASDLTAHSGNGDIHVTAKQKTDWQAATDAINLFFDEAGMNSDDASAFVDTLKEIQDYITGDASAAATMAADITKAQTAADNAQADVDAVEKALGAGFSEASTVAAQLAAVKTTADDAATKDELKAVTDSYVISFGGAKGAISVDTAPDSSGYVEFVMDGSTLTGHVKGINSAAYEPSTAFDAAGAATTAKNEVIGETGDASNKVTLYGVKAYADALKADADSSIDALQTLVGSTKVSTQISSAIAELDSTLDATEGKYVEKVVIVDGKIDTAASVVKSLPAATVEGVDTAAKSSNYVSIATSLVNKEVVVTPTVTLQDVSTAGEGAKGLAEASDVKSYVDNQIATNALSWVVLE